MAKRGTKRAGEVIVRSEAAFTPGADGYTKSGDMIFKNEDSAKEWTKKLKDQTGRKLFVNPDGGVPHGEEDRRMFEADRRGAAEAQERAEKKRREEFERRLNNRRR